MIEPKPYGPHFVSCGLCIKSGLEIEEIRPGEWHTHCGARHECYGCNGESDFVSSVDPRGYKEVEQHCSMELIPYEVNAETGRIFMTNEEIEKCLERFRYLPEDYWWTREIRADLDTIIIWKYVDGNS